MSTGATTLRPVHSADATLLNSTTHYTQAQPTALSEARPVTSHSMILEEDGSNGTASDSAEPVTPVSDTHPHAFRLSNVPLDATNKMPPAELGSKPLQAAAAVHQPPVPRSQPANVHTTPQPKPGLIKRVGSSMKAKLHRTASHKVEEPVMTSAVYGSSGPVPIPTSAAQAPPPPPSPPKTRRLGSFSFSGHKTPPSSQSDTSPSKGSPTSTITEENQSEKAPSSVGYDELQQSQSASDLHGMSRPRHGITWAAGYDPRGEKMAVPQIITTRRRSLSSDALPRMQLPDQEAESDRQTARLQVTYSKMAAEGAGLKARRLSTSLPDEFFVDYCELDEEFKSSTSTPFKRGQLLGKGATAVVRLMKKKNGPSDVLYAVKEFRGRDKSEDEAEYIKKVKSEYSIAKSLHHPNIVETVRLCTHSGRWNHVMEYCQIGEMYSLVEKGFFRTHYRLEDRLCFFKQIVRGVDYLHGHGIAHRDIKLENLLMNNDGHVKITDFGVSEVFSGVHPGLRAAAGQCGKSMGEIRRCAPGICGSLPYIAPEVLEKQGDYDPRPLDVWSCAIVFLTMTYSGSPWQAAKTEHEFYAKFKKGWDEWLPNHPDGELTDGPDGTPKCGLVFTKLDNPALKRLMLKMLHPIPEKRILIHDVLMTSCVKNIDCCSPETLNEAPSSVDACAGKASKSAKATVLKKHSHLPPKEHKTPKVLQHRFDMGHGWH